VLYASHAARAAVQRDLLPPTTIVPFIHSFVRSSIVREFVRFHSDPHFVIY